MSVRPAKTQISLIRIFAMRSMGSQWHKLSSCGLRRLSAQSDLSLRWAHIPFVGFVMRRLICGSNFGCCVSKGSLQIVENSQQLSLCRVAALKVSPYIDIVLLFLHFLVLWTCRILHLFGNRVALNPGLGGVRDFASAMNRLYKTELLFSYFGCCISKGPLQIIMNRVTNLKVRLRNSTVKWMSLLVF